MSFLSKVMASHYNLPKLPDELKYAKTLREKQYLEIINKLYTVVQADPMTGLTHKEHFRATEKGPGVYIMIDGDGLKKMNDKFGHEVGHAAILALAQGIRAAIRKDTTMTRKETVTRAGGDEFIVHVSDVSIPTGMVVANRILESIRKQKISDHYKGTANIKKEIDDIQLSASLGVGYTEEDADKALYKAKENGRSRVEFYKGAVEKKAA